MNFTHEFNYVNTPGARIGPRSHNQTLAVTSKTKHPKISFRIRTKLILQGLRVAQAAVTERWPQKAEKHPKNHLFFLKK